jgi:uncharacterized sulfatase
VGVGGYDTALIGKWHLGARDEHHPTRHGYGLFQGFRVGGEISKDPLVEIDGVERRIEGYTPDILTDLAIEFVRRDRPGPFLLSVHFWAPHANTANRTPDGDRTWLPLSDADWGPVRDRELSIPNPEYPDLDIARLKRMRREYLGAVASVDRNIGRLMDALAATGKAENTLVVFTSDNGFNMGHNGIWHKGNGRWILLHNRGDRPNMYDNSLRVPLIVRWPGVIAPGRTITETGSHFDWYPTLLEAAGAPASTPRFRGRSLLPLFRGEAGDWDNDLFAQYSMWDWHQNGAKPRSYRTPQLEADPRLSPPRRRRALQPGR